MKKIKDYFIKDSMSSPHPVFTECKLQLGSKEVLSRWIPASAGMTVFSAGMTAAGMTVFVVMTAILLGLQGCFLNIAGDGKEGSAVSSGIKFNSSYIGSLSVVRSDKWEDWHSQARFFEHFGAVDNQQKRELNENNFASKISLINASDDYNIQVVFNTDQNKSDIIKANFRRGDRDGSPFVYNQRLFSKDVEIKRSNIKSLNNLDLKHASDWKIFISGDGNEIEGYRTGTLNSNEEKSKSVVRFKVYLDKYKIVQEPPKNETDDEEPENSEAEDESNPQDDREQEVVN